MKSYQRLNNLIGWSVFLVATIVYMLTLEPTVSFWDCGEFISAAYKLQVCHPPGAPLYIMIGRLFSLLSFGDPSRVAYWVNALSGISSSFTILFLFWTITAFAKKIVDANFKEKNQTNYTPLQLLSIMGSGVVGALAYTFSDTFWYSAVEAEVYAMSSLFTAVVFWLVLKWDSAAEDNRADRYLILIAYLMGLSIGVHLLNLLVIPAITLFYYYKKNKTTTTWGVWKSIGIGFLILIAVQYGLIPGIPKLMALFERLFVNTFGFPFHTGIYVFIVVLIAAITGGIVYTIKKQKVMLNHALLSVAFMLIGYSSYAMIMIRSAANPSMDENNPENVYTLLSYLNREQYGSRPLLYGPYFNAPLDSKKPYKDGNPVYFKAYIVENNGKKVADFGQEYDAQNYIKTHQLTNAKIKHQYIITDDGKKAGGYNFSSEYSTFFPRMYSSESNHVSEYIRWTGIKNPNKKPSFADNLKFYFSYQIGHMYLRYFMWNFVGKQNDIQGHGDAMNGNWISGIPFIDSIRLGNQSDLPESFANNKARNKYYFLPLILGLLGVFFQFSKDKKNGIVTLLLFFITGILLVTYLNQPPTEPRERDYTYVASFYVFAIWIGLGVLSLIYSIKNMTQTKAIAVVAASLILVPVLMAKENWDDHDRSDRYMARDIAYNYLNSCEKNAILFSVGDNETFPLWYLQEVEGVRTDVRVCNLSLLNTDWYINQMKRKVYDSEPLPIAMQEPQYRQGERDQLFVLDKGIEGFVDVKKQIDWVLNNNGQNKVPLQSGGSVYYFPSPNFRIPVDSQAVAKQQVVAPELLKNIQNIEWNIGKDYVLKSELIVLDILANNNWQRPIYFCVTSGNDSYLGLDNYLQYEGLTLKLIPVKNNNTEEMQIATAAMYDNLMNKFKWGNMDKKGIYIDENVTRMSNSFRNLFSILANDLISKGKKKEAKEVLDKCLAVMPHENIPYSHFMLFIAEAYINLGENASAEKILNTLESVYGKELAYYQSFGTNVTRLYKREISTAGYILQAVEKLRDNMKILQENPAEKQEKEKDTVAKK